MIKVHVYARQKQTNRCRKQTSGSQRGEGNEMEKIKSISIRDKS